MKVVVKNKKAYFNYEITDKFHAGIVLTGSEIKAIRTNNVAIQESYVSFKNNEVFIINMNINNYKFSTAYQIDPLRNRKLLLNRKEIVSIFAETKTKKLIIIPLCLYLNNKGLAKLEIGLARPKKLYDKRNDLKAKTLKKEISNESY